MDDKQDSLLVFPCEFPIKIMGRASDDFEAEIVSLVRRHVPDLGEAAIKRRQSTANNYAALTVTITATSKAQLDAIYQELSANERVLMAL